MNEALDHTGLMPMGQRLDAIVDVVANQSQSLDSTIALLRDQHKQLGEEIDELTKSRSDIADQINRLLAIRNVMDNAATEVRTIVGAIPPVTAPVSRKRASKTEEQQS